jgi:alanyl-tRNA synthetase
MKKIGLNELRHRFLSFFEGKDHIKMESFSLVPHKDKSLLLINSGMAPLKPYFTGSIKPPSQRITTCQKCMRTPDIENVGKTARHGTFFEMLGNFSFADYFKSEAIEWAWEFLTKELEIPEERLYVSVYEEDDEALEIWHQKIGLPKEKIYKLGKEDNFWEHGTGPCGPCSEIYYDMGESFGCGLKNCQVGCDCDRYIEVWNLVFTQYHKDEDGHYDLLDQTNIDTGMGLERLACAVQGVDNIFEVDVVRAILQKVCEISRKKYGENQEVDLSIRVITDHIRSISMMISDGVMPSNDGRGYVLRRILRRASRHGRIIGIEDIFLEQVFQTVSEQYGEAYPSLRKKSDFILNIIRREERSFHETLSQGMDILINYLQSESMNKVVEGEMVFKLHDTYGFPVDMTREIAQEHGFDIDKNGFLQRMQVQKNRAREALLRAKGNDAWEKALNIDISGLPHTQFVGYAQPETSGKVLRIFKGSEKVEQLSHGESGIIVLDQTTVYAESGGQVADSGWIKHELAMGEVTQCTKSAEGIFLHDVTLMEGKIQVGDECTIKINEEKRRAISRNHTATHLLNAVLRELLGNHVHQAGSLVTEERLRFDFSHVQSVDSEQIKQIEDLLNQRILQNDEVVIDEMSLEEATQKGAIGLFEDKYGKTVRVVHIGEVSVELCGGTHVQKTSDIGLFKVLSESSVASGVRRIEATTGAGVYGLIKEWQAVLEKMGAILKVPIHEIANKVESIHQTNKENKKEIQKLMSKIATQNTTYSIDRVKDIQGIPVFVHQYEGVDSESLRNQMDLLRNKLQTGLIVLASKNGDKCIFVAGATKDIIEKGIHSGNLVKTLAKYAGGGGGGRADYAQAGGKDASKINEALSHLEEMIQKQLSE